MYQSQPNVLAKERSINASRSRTRHFSLQHSHYTIQIYVKLCINDDLSLISVHNDELVLCQS